MVLPFVFWTLQTFLQLCAVWDNGLLGKPSISIALLLVLFPMHFLIFFVLSHMWGRRWKAPEKPSFTIFLHGTVLLLLLTWINWCYFWIQYSLIEIIASSITVIPSIPHASATSEWQGGFAWFAGSSQMVPPMRIEDGSSQFLPGHAAFSGSSINTHVNVHHFVIYLSHKHICFLQMYLKLACLCFQRVWTISGMELYTTLLCT